jgi:hyperosmotically inducible periplasmic protein
MRAFFNGLVLGIIFGVIAYWYFQKQAAVHPEAEQRYEQAAAQTMSNATVTAHSMSDALAAKLETLDLNTDQIKDELSKTGEVVRRKAQDIGAAAVSTASDARAVAEIKSKYAMDSSLSAWKISVSSNQGHVKLSGTVKSTDDIGKAIALALDADGVRDVTSTIEVQQ